MLAHYGYKDGAGEFFIVVDTDRCNGCGDCAPACPAGVLVVGEDENDPLNDNLVAAVAEEHRRKIKYSCAPCKPERDRPLLPCLAVCQPNALTHSW